jgi:hypothetical protein
MFLMGFACMPVGNHAPRGRNGAAVYGELPVAQSLAGRG